MTHDPISTTPEAQPTHEAYEAVPKPSVIYRSYLLRLWRVDAGHEGGVNTPWRAMLESVTEPSERHNFPDLEGLFAFLRVKAD